MRPDLLSVIKEGAERAPSVMAGPESDWTPILMFEQADGVCRTAAIPGMTPDTVAICADAVKHMLLDARAVQAALVLTTYFTELTMSGVDQNERVLVTHVTPDHIRCEAAVIYRSKSLPPTLGPWDRVADGLEVGAGVFMDAMRSAIS